VVGVEKIGYEEQEKRRGVLPFLTKIRKGVLELLEKWQGRWERGEGGGLSRT